MAEYKYEQLEQIPGASDLIGTLSGAVWRSPLEFETPLHEERRRLVLRWRSTAATAGVATVWDGQSLASVSLAVMVTLLPLSSSAVGEADTLNCADAGAGEGVGEGVGDGAVGLVDEELLPHAAISMETKATANVRFMTRAL